MSKAFFLDRDGTLNVDYNFVHLPQEWTWCDGAIEALRLIKENGFKVIVVTNQSGVARSRYSEQDVLKLHRWVDRELHKYGITIDDWYFAAHHPEHDPNENYEPKDRKPGIGMFEKAAEEHKINFTESFMAGDKVTDLKPAVKLGMKPFFIRSRHKAQQDMGWIRQHKIGVYDTLLQAVSAEFKP